MEKNSKMEKYLSLIDIYLIVARNIRTLIFYPSIGFLIAISYLLFFSVPMYTSSGKISSSSSGSKPQFSGLASQFGINLSAGTSSTSWVYPEIIKSRQIAKRMLVKTFKSDENNEKKLINILLDRSNIFDFNNVDTVKALNKFISLIDIQEDRKTGIYTIQITTKNNLLSKQLLQALFDELQNFQLTYNQNQHKKAREFIEERISLTRIELVKAEETLKNFTSKNRRIENSPQLLLEKNRLNRDVSVPLQVFTTLREELETAKIEEYKEKDYIVIIDNPSLSLNPSKPNISIVIFALIMAGLFVSIFTIIFIEYKSELDEKEQAKILKANEYLKHSINR